MSEEPKHIKAMRLLVEWRNMKDLCEERTTCIECPYNLARTCDMVSTEHMLNSVSNIFTEYLARMDKPRNERG